MFSTLLIVSALIGSHIVLATDDSASNTVGVNTDRQNRQFWLPPSSHPFANPYYNDRYWPSGHQQQAPYNPEYRRKQFSDEEDSELARQNLFGLSNINSAVNPFASFFNKLQPTPFIKNPNQQNVLRRYDACTDPAGKGGVCVPALFCSKYGGRPSGSCSTPGLICCVNAVTKCGGQITLNNTYWESPPTVNPQSTCGLTVTLDTNLIEQKRPVCQLRLDFKAFSIDQPGADSLCSQDSFTVTGATNKVPTICGENIDQHMYIDVPSSTNSLVLMFTFGAKNVPRTWNIQIGMLSCNSNTLAPSGCLQYFSGSATGTIKSFNWKDVAPTATRQLANQDYSICFRNELSGSATSTRICYTACAVPNGGRAFSISGDGATTAVDAPNSGDVCTNDFLVIRDGSGTNTALPPGAPPGTPLGTSTADRFCGNRINPVGAVFGNTQICSSIRDFKVLYRTNGVETPDNVNSGFCLTFTQQVV